MNYFNLNDYQGDDVCMHCPTLEDAEIFLEFLDNAGRLWSSGVRYTSNSLFYSSYGEATCYYFNEGTYGSLDYALGNNYTVLEFGDFSWADDQFENEEDAKMLDTFFSQFCLSKEE